MTKLLVTGGSRGLGRAVVERALGQWPRHARLPEDLRRALAGMDAVV